ncbi:hypothetical protein C2S52_003904 [Perilla frutescens var. hirtella]|nr:hypothetical protein C2S52_003904 [Perilla frutescens var. hirtella]
MASVAASAKLSSQSFQQPFEFETTLKVIAESSTLKAVPSKFNFSNEPTAFTSESLPIIDFSALITSDPHQRSKALHDLTGACRDWGFFILVNHGIPESLMNATFTAIKQFLSLPDSEKKQYEAKSASDPIKCGNFNVANTSNQSFTLWRDYLKLYVHPEFHCPQQPQLLRDTLPEFAEKTRPVLRQLLQAIGENLGFEDGFIDETLKLDKCFQLYAANYYPPCPQPDQAIGIPAHTDHGLLTFLIHNGVAGLQIQHNGEWFDTNSPQNSILVNTGDHLEILSNGRYKSVRHRAVVNTEKMRISVVMANGAAPDAVVAPAPQFVEQDGRPKYRAMKFIEYVETMLSNRLLGKTNLDCIKIQED